jgi:hypothetical protein
MNRVKKWTFALLLCVVSGIGLPGQSEAHCRRHEAGPMQQIVLEVCHPRTECKLQVPVCVPVCCQGVPCVRFQRTLLGPGKTVFSWACGYEVVVRYTHSGGYRVTNPT